MAEGKGTPTSEQENESAKQPPWWKRLWARTGFGDKTLWDLLQLLIVPLALAVIGLWFTVQQDARQSKIEEQRAQDAALQAYLGQMSTLMLEKELRNSEEESEVRTLARARTLTVLSRLDPVRRKTVLRFLYEADLIFKPSSVVSLDGANLQGVNLRYVDLSGHSFAGGTLRGAYVCIIHKQAGTNKPPDTIGCAGDTGARNRLVGYDTSIRGSDLSGTNLRNADLTGAFLVEADLTNASLAQANLRNAALIGAELYKADLSGADLTGASLTDATGLKTSALERQAKSLEGATMPNGQKYEDWIKSKDHGENGENSGPS
jgi:hypothetical protein